MLEPLETDSDLDLDKPIDRLKVLLLLLVKPFETDLDAVHASLSVQASLSVWLRLFVSLRLTVSDLILVVLLLLVVELVLDVLLKTLHEEPPDSVSERVSDLLFIVYGSVTVSEVPSDTAGVNGSVMLLL